MELVCHPANPCPLALRLAVTLKGSPTGLELHYQVRGQVDGILLPVAVQPGPADGLWQHTCFEAFVSPVLAAHYREFNFAPSGQWAAYRFSAERQRDVEAENSQPLQPGPFGLKHQHGPSQFDLWATLPDAALPPGPRLCVGLSAVIETRSGHLSYWALQHPKADRPDFHHRGGWRELPRPSLN